jgi:hypothetical protein
MTEFRVTLTDGTTKTFKFNARTAGGVVTPLGQLIVNSGYGVVLALGPGEWKRFEHVAATPEPAWWPKGDGEA